MSPRCSMTGSHASPPASTTKVNRPIAFFAIAYVFNEIRGKRTFNRVFDSRFRLVFNGEQPVKIEVVVTVGIMTNMGEQMLINDRYGSSIAADETVGDEDAPHTARVDRRDSDGVRDLLPRQVQQERGLDRIVSGPKPVQKCPQAGRRCGPLQNRGPGWQSGRLQ